MEIFQWPKTLGSSLDQRKRYKQHHQREWVLHEESCLCLWLWNRLLYCMVESIATMSVDHQIHHILPDCHLLSRTGPGALSIAWVYSDCTRSKRRCFTSVPSCTSSSASTSVGSDFRGLPSPPFLLSAFIAMLDLQIHVVMVLALHFMLKDDLNDERWTSSWKRLR